MGDVEPHLEAENSYGAKPNIGGVADRLRAVQRESLRQSEHLFQSLLHHAFSI